MELLNYILYGGKYRHITNDIEKSRKIYNQCIDEKMGKIEDDISKNMQGDNFYQEAKNGNNHIVVYNKQHDDKLHCIEIVDNLNKRANFPIKFKKYMDRSDMCTISVDLKNNKI